MPFKIRPHPMKIRLDNFNIRLGTIMTMPFNRKTLPRPLKIWRAPVKTMPNTIKIWPQTIKILPNTGIMKVRGMCNITPTRHLVVASALSRTREKKQ